MGELISKGSLVEGRVGGCMELQDNKSNRMVDSN